MSRLQLTMACGPYDRTRALADGRVRVEGVDLRYLCLDPEEIFFRMARHEEFDVSEMSLSTYLLSHLAGSPFVAIPVFPSRFFRHSGVYVRSDSDLTHPSQLKGGRIGVAEWQLTANVWIRGILADLYDLPTDAVRYRTGGLLEPGRPEKLKVDLEGRFDVRPIGESQTLSAMLAAGEIDVPTYQQLRAALLESRGGRQ